jgi:hypothetical protein
VDDADQGTLRFQEELLERWVDSGDVIEQPGGVEEEDADPESGCPGHVVD